MTATTDVDQQALCEAWTEVPGPPNTPLSSCWRKTPATSRACSTSRPTPERPA
jgi:hypothetical protein